MGDEMSWFKNQLLKSDVLRNCNLIKRSLGREGKESPKPRAQGIENYVCVCHVLINKNLEPYGAVFCQKEMKITVKTGMFCSVACGKH